MTKERLIEIARETVAIAESGTYAAPSGRTVDISRAVAAAKSGTRLYQPGMVPRRDPIPGSGPPEIQVSGETTGEACRRLAEDGVPVVALNFASAKNPGGGFLRGTKAQEEDLARCSALHACLLQAPDYYSVNRACGTALYTDHIVYSPDVPFFRGEDMALLERPFPVSVITAPAPNAGEARESRGEVLDALRRRAAAVLDVAAAERHGTLVLGAWGCGVFRNDPSDVARTFCGLLRSPGYAGLFSRVLFAVYDPDPAGRKMAPFLNEILSDRPEDS